MFTQWDEATEDQVATNLNYQQDVRGVKFSDYRCDKEEHLTMFVAQQYITEYGTDMSMERLLTLLPNFNTRFLPERHQKCD